jgi:NADH-ubiquinone oxidoreductase chain 5
MAGLGANFEYNLKKIIALSTLSQLGLIIGAVWVGFVDLAFFHLLTHALFNALLFVCADNFHTIKDSQDIRFMGNLSFPIPFPSVCLSASSFASCGIPFVPVFFCTKDLILEIVSFSYINLIGFFQIVLSTGLLFVIHSAYFILFLVAILI